MINIRQVKKSSPLTLIPFLFLGAAHASPNSETKWLMDEPASLFDVGMYRTSVMVEEGLDDYIKRLNEGNKKEFILSLFSSSDVEYNWDKDQILLRWDISYAIETLVTLKGKKQAMDTQEKVKYFCRGALSKLIDNAYGQSDSWNRNKGLEILNNQKLRKNFGHLGYSSKDMPKNMYRNLALKITYQVFIQPSSNDYDTFEKKKKSKPRATQCTIGFDNPLSNSTPMYEMFDF